MSIKGGSYANFRRALASRDLTLVRAAAAELPQVSLDDALEVCLLLRGAEPASYERATVRWLGRFCLERRGATITHVQKAAQAFERLPADPAGAVGVLKWLVRQTG
ncbi:MAG TPA: hypothetical protein VEQ61_02775 [Thermoleophilaceae bacterium]|nr:hypothetical protein [Thermoleophilaceae bacterium]